MIVRCLLATAVLGALAMPVLAQAPANQESCFSLIDKIANEAEEKTVDKKASREIGSLLQTLTASCSSNDMVLAGNAVSQLRSAIAKLPN